MASKSPAFSFYPDNWLGGTRRMSRIEKSVYLDLLCDQWITGGFSMDEAKFVCNDVDPDIVEKVIRYKFEQMEDGLYYNRRLEKERGKSLVREKRRLDLSTSDWRRKRRAVIDRDGPFCSYCQKECSDDPTIDHQIPYSKGGTSELDNLVVSCRPCNARKKDMTRKEYEAHYVT